jgi:hypothetical protein
MLEMPVYLLNLLKHWNNLIGLMLPIITIAALGLVKGIQFNHKYIGLIIGFLLYSLASTIKFGELHPRFIGIFILKFSLAYIILTSLRTRFFSIYEHILFYLSLIAIVFWIFHNIAPELFVNFLQKIEFSTQGPEKGSIRMNAIVFTISNYDLVDDHIADFGAFRLFRNSGFAWEPGAFSAFLNIAILFNMLRTKFQLKNNIRFIVYVIALATTFSTTGYLMFILLIIFTIYNQNFKKILVLIPVALIFILYLFSLPFMSKKIAETAEYDTKELIYLSLKYNNQYIPQRFQSFQIDYIDFLNHPVIGYGGHDEARWTNQMGAQISTISGLGKVMAQFGIVGILFFTISLWLSSKNLISVFNVRGVIFPFLFIVMLAISYNIFSILYMCIWLFFISSFYKTEVIKHYLNHYFLKKPRPDSVQ